MTSKVTERRARKGMLPRMARAYIKEVVRKAGFEIIHHDQIALLHRRLHLDNLLMCDLVDAERDERRSIYQFYEFIQSRLQSSVAQCLQDLWVLFELNSVRGGFFVEFGASDGMRNSNTFLLERDYGWRGVLIEPVPEEFQKLRQNRPNAVCIEASIASGAGQCELVVPDDPQFAADKRVAGDDRYAGYRAESGRRIIVKAMELNDAIAAGKPQGEIVDFLSIDTEGGEADSLESLDFDRWKVLCVCVEHNNRVRDAERIKKLMASRGFSMSPCRSTMFQDFWFINRDLIRKFGGERADNYAGV